MFSLQSPIFPQRFSRTTRIATFRNTVMLSVIALVGICIMGCGSAPTSNCTAQPGFICGRAVDSQGNPLPQAIIEVYGTATVNGYPVDMNISANPDGTYGPRQLQDGNYTVHARVQVTYQGINWNLQLRPDDGVNNNLLSVNGIVKNFTWKLTGLQPGGDPNIPGGYYGAYIAASPGIGGNIPAGSHLNFQLTPQGRLVDGSPGQTLTFNNMDAAGDGYLKDIPLGVYTISATGTDSNGTAFPVCFNGQPTMNVMFSNQFSQGYAIARPDMC